MTPVRPSLLPDEMASGYFGRVMSINGWKKAGDALSQLTAWAKRIDPSQINHSPLRVLAMVAECDLETFVMRHTLLPLTVDLEINPLRVAEALNHPLASDLVRFAGGRNSAFFCEACVEEDIHAVNELYWRREHQIPGLVYCRTHGEPLIKSHEYTSSPEVARRNRSEDRDVGPISWDSLRAFPATRRYIEICVWFLNNDISLDAQEVSRTARERAVEIRVQPDYQVYSARSLTAFLRRHFDYDWLHGRWGAVYNRRVSTHVSLRGEIISGALCRLPVTTYLVVFAAMYPSTASAIEALVRKSDQDSPNVAARRIVA